MKVISVDAKKQTKNLKRDSLMRHPFGAPLKQENDSFNNSKQHAKNLCRFVALCGFVIASIMLIFKKK